MPLWQSTGHSLKAIVFDLDGTLYDQTPVRLGMMWRLLAFTCRHPKAGLEAMRVLRAFRDAQERLRHVTGSVAAIAEAQAEEAAARTGASLHVVHHCVKRWMEMEPLDLLRPARRDGVVETMANARARGLKLGIVSDYPAAAKIAALRLDRTFDTIVCAQDADVQRFKPDPRGLLVAIARLGVTPEQTLYVGDRPEVDGEAAMRAGVASVMVARRSIPHRDPRRGLATYSCRALADALKREPL